MYVSVSREIFKKQTRTVLRLPTEHTSVQEYTKQPQTGEVNTIFPNEIAKETRKKKNSKRN